MNRLLCGELIKAALAPEALVVCSLGSVNRTWRTVGAAQPTYFCSDPMGISLSIGLGLALAKPDRPIAMLCGDGDLMMGLSSLATVAGVAPPNLQVVVFNNAVYETGGAQPLANPAVDFAAIARGAGFVYAETVGDEAAARRLIPDLFARDGLGLLAVKIDRDALGYGPPIPESQAEERALFMARLREVDDAR